MTSKRCCHGKEKKKNNRYGFERIENYCETIASVRYENEIYDYHKFRIENAKKKHRSLSFFRVS